jgi:type I restriction-modification system DNA methylase subunit
MSLVEEGMVMAVKNFKTKLDHTDQNNNTNNNNNIERYTLLVVSRIWPDHYGLSSSNEMSNSHIDHIVNTYGKFEENDYCKIKDNLLCIRKNHS